MVERFQQPHYAENISGNRSFFFFFPPYISAFLEMIFLFHISNVTSNRQVYLCANFKMIEIATSQPENPISGKYSKNLFQI